MPAGGLRSALGAVTTAWVVFATIRVAEACAVCFGGEESDWTAGFVLGTLVMLVLPPSIIGGAVFALYRSIKRQDARVAEAESAEVLSAGSSDVVRS